MTDFLILLIGLICVATPAWILGWHFGVKSFRNRNRQLMKAIEDNNKVYRDWAASPEGTNWEAGYQAGISHTLNTIAGFIEKASD